MKRIFDFFVSLAALLTLSPVLLVLYFIIAIKMGIPVFFVQARPGMKGHIFKMVKFRSMTDAKGADGELLPDTQRLPTFGQILRATSLDELPELWNVLKGEMSLVGPRPLLIEYLDKYTPEQSRRHEVRPGVTGWAQVNGRNALSWDEKFTLDIWYVNNRTFWLDIKILFMTVKQVFKRDNISQDGHVTMEKFKGSE
jgi:sugar transferase EpsL